jgi:hypothetical protein
LKQILIIILSVSTVIGCGGKKQLLNRNMDNEFLKAFWENQQEFEYLTLKGKININSSEISQTANLNMRMKRDSVIWMSVGMLGFEGMRILVTADSFKMINQLQHTYLARSRNYFNELLGFEVEIRELQNLLLGIPPFDSSLYKIQKNDTSSWLLGTKNEMVNHLLISESFKTLRCFIYSKLRTETAEVFYSEFENFGKLTLPSRIKAIMENGPQVSKAEINYSSISEESIISFPFNVPDDAKRI